MQKTEGICIFIQAAKIAHSNQAESADWFIDDFWYLVYTIFILVQAMMPVLGTAPALLPDDGRSESGLMCFYFWRNGKGGAATGKAPIVT